MSQILARSSALPLNSCLRPLVADKWFCSWQLGVIRSLTCVAEKDSQFGSVGVLFRKPMQQRYVAGSQMRIVVESFNDSLFPFDESDLHEFCKLVFLLTRDRQHEQSFVGIFLRDQGLLHHRCSV
jgi:hypothetical protein